MPFDPVSFFIYFALSLILTAISYLLRPKSTIDNAEKPNLSEFTYPTADSGRVVPRVYGTVKLYGNVIYQGTVSATPIYSTAGEGKSEQSYISGYAWYASFAYALCSTVDAILEFRMNDEVKWQGEIAASSGTINCTTGVKSDIYGSASDTSQFLFYRGDHSIANAYLQQATGYDIVYKGLCFLVFTDAYMGDNVSTIPTYSEVVRNCKFINRQYGALGGYDWTLHAEINDGGSIAYSTAVTNQGMTTPYGGGTAATVYGLIVDTSADPPNDKAYFQLDLSSFANSSYYSVELTTKMQHGDQSNGSDMADLEGMAASFTKGYGDTYTGANLLIPFSIKSDAGVKRYVRMVVDAIFYLQVQPPEGETPAPTLIIQANYTLTQATAYYRDANPAHVILDYFLTDLKSPSANLDLASFYNQGETLYNEKLGISFQMDNAQKTEEWIKEILRTIDGVIYSVISTKKITLRLIRDDYDIETIPVINDDKASDMDPNRQGFEDIDTYIGLKFTDRLLWDGNSIYGVNPAAEEILKYRKSASYDFNMISNVTSAKEVMKRLFRKTTYPLASVKLTVSRMDYPTLVPGDVFKWESEIEGISNMPMRIVNMSSGDINQQEMDLECIEDIFGIGNIDLDPILDNLHEPQEWDIGNILYRKIVDAPAEASTNSAVIVACCKPYGTVSGVKVYINNHFFRDIDPTMFGYGKLVNEYGIPTGIVQNASEVDDASGGFLVQPICTMRNIAATRGAFQRLKYMALVGSEFIGFQNCVLQESGNYLVTNIMRGLLNSDIAVHTAGEEIWFFYLDGNEMQTFGITPGGVSATVKMVPFNSKKLGPALTVTHAYGFTREKPYPPFNVKAVTSWTGVHRIVTLTWETSKRLAGANYRDPDGFAAGETSSEGYWYVAYWDVEDVETIYQAYPTTPIYEVEVAPGRTYIFQVRSVIDGYFSPPNRIAEIQVNT